MGVGCRRAGIATLLVRHHPDFFNEDTLVGIVADCELAGVHVLVDCSNTDAPSIASQVRCVERGARIVVHEKDMRFDWFVATHRFNQWLAHD